METKRFHLGTATQRTKQEDNGTLLSIVECIDAGSVNKNQFQNAGCVVCQIKGAVSMCTQ